jgi:hypothetical protein
MKNIDFLERINIKDDWETPVELYQELDNRFHFTFDPCPISPQEDGLNIEWHGSVFCNPPYSEVSNWIAKGYNEIISGHVDCLVFLVYAKTDTRWFHTYIYKNPIISWEIEFIKGRVKFGNHGKRSPAPFPSMLLIYQKNHHQIRVTPSYRCIAGVIGGRAIPPLSSDIGKSRKTPNILVLRGLQQEQFLRTRPAYVLCY